MVIRVEKGCYKDEGSEDGEARVGGMRYGGGD